MCRVVTFVCVWKWERGGGEMEKEAPRVEEILILHQLGEAENPSRLVGTRLRRTAGGRERVREREREITIL